MAQPDRDERAGDMIPVPEILDRVGGMAGIAAAADQARNSFGAQVLSSAVKDAAARTDAADHETWSRCLEACELAALMLCGDEDTARLGVDENKTLQALCSHAFEFHRALGDAGSGADALKRTLTATCLAILASRVDDWRRWRKAIGWPLDGIEIPANDWAGRLFFTTSDAFLRLVRKAGWSDLRAVADFVEDLRSDQAAHETVYLEAQNGIRQAAALEVISFYHFAKAVESAAEFTGHGKPDDATGDVALHMRHAIEGADAGGIVEWAVLLRWLRAALRRLIETTLWHQLSAYNHRITEFKHALTRDEANWRPLFELLPPQQDAVHSVMSLALRAVVVQMPTSSGKTLLAQFRIIQAKTNYPDGWIAYLVPTRALVNQIAARLRRSFAPLDGIRVEIASPAEEFDAFEEQLFTGDQFDVLVTTPEKLDLIIRGERIDLNRRPLSLVVCDEAHHIACQNDTHREAARRFVGDTMTELVSAIEALLADVERLGGELDLSRLGRNDPKWSAFVQYLSHCYRQLGSAARFADETERILTRTYAYIRLEKNRPASARKLLEAVRAYGAKLAGYGPGILALVDSTGFSPESIRAMASNKEQYLPRTWSDWSPSRLFRTGGGIAAIVGRLLSIREAQLSTPAGVNHQLLSKLIVGWVNGQSLAELATLVPNKDQKPNEDHVTDVARLVFRHVARTASWGLGAAQGLAEIKDAEPTADEIRAFKSLPSMIYYGCRSPEGVLMRTLGVVRSVCEPLGAAYRESTAGSENEIADARNWLMERSEDDWGRAARSRSRLSGAEHRKLWRIINGMD